MNPGAGVAFGSRGGCGTAADLHEDRAAIATARIDEHCRVLRLEESQFCVSKLLRRSEGGCLVAKVSAPALPWFRSIRECEQVFFIQARAQCVEVG